MGRLAPFILGLIIGIILLPAIAWFYLRLGYAPVATAAPPLPLERTVTHMALEARIKSEAPKDSPVPMTEENTMEGARLYRHYCSVCHGLIGQADSSTAKGMFPKPPQLFHGHGVTDDPPGETYWKVSNGIRLTGMPAYGGSLSTDEMWKISLMLAHADQLSPATKQILQQPLPAE